MPTIQLYDKSQIDERIPDNSGADNGTVLTKTADGNAWITTETSEPSHSDILAILKGKVKGVYMPTRIGATFILDSITEQDVYINAGIPEYEENLAKALNTDYSLTILGKEVTFNAYSFIDANIGTSTYALKVLRYTVIIDDTKYYDDAIVYEYVESIS